MEYLKSNGVKFGENGISKTHSKNSGNTYYATESRYIKNLIEKFRKEKIIETRQKVER